MRRNRPKNGKEAWDVCLKMRDMGTCKPYSRRYYRFAPPLVITKKNYGSLRNH